MAKEFLSMEEGVAWAGRVCSAEIVSGRMNDIFEKWDYEYSFSRNPLIGTIDNKRCICSDVDLNKASKLRLPIVSAGTNVDYDSIIFVPKNAQEALDMTVLSYKVCENNRVLLPSLILIDRSMGMVEIPTKPSIKKFLPDLSVPHLKEGTIHKRDDLEFESQKIEAFKNAESYIEKEAEEWNKKFKRDNGLIETMGVEDAEDVLIVYGSISDVAIKAAEKMITEKEKVGIIRLRTLKPVDTEKIREITEGKRIGIIDTHVSKGRGVAYNELLPVFGNRVSSFIVRSLSEDNVKSFFRMLEEGEKTWII